MLSFSDLELNSLKPVYLQLIEHIKKQVVLGEIKNGDGLPSRREVAAQLGINPNTVQKAYKQLEAEGLIETSNNAKSVIVITRAGIDGIQKELKTETTKEYLAYLKSIGLTFKDTIELITELWQ